MEDNFKAVTLLTRDMKLFDMVLALQLHGYTLFDCFEIKHNMQVYDYVIGMI